MNLDTWDVTLPEPMHQQEGHLSIDKKQLETLSPISPEAADDQTFSGYVTGSTPAEATTTVLGILFGEDPERRNRYGKAASEKK